jgi:hypothetical protein
MKLQNKLRNQMYKLINLKSVKLISNMWLTSLPQKKHISYLFSGAIYSKL